MRVFKYVNEFEAKVGNCAPLSYYLCEKFPRFFDLDHMDKLSLIFTAQKIKFSIKNFFSKCDRISSFLHQHIASNTLEMLSHALHLENHSKHK